MSIYNNFEQLYCRRPHVVIIGAGASKAVMGKLCPTMDEAISQIGLEKLLRGVKLLTQSDNLEAIYSELYKRGDECKEARIAMENRIFEYFSNVQLPETLTIYDLLILSLTRKDCIISFNWDSLLIQAFNRISEITDNKPELLFLHGNVGAGLCEDCKTFGPIQNKCPKCGRPFKHIPLLYPVDKKDYNSNIFIRDQWNVAQDFISRAGKVTIYGYRAPSSDKEASDILKSSFSKYDGVHRLDYVEIIERPGFDRNELSETWKYFISLTNEHFDIVDSFYKSSLAIAPRRSLEFQYKKYIGSNWNDPSIYYSDNESFYSVWKKLKPLLENEKIDDFHVI